MSSPETPEAPTLAEIEQALAWGQRERLHEVLQQIAACLRSGAYALVSRQQQAERSSPSGLAETLRGLREQLRQMRDWAKQQPGYRPSDHVIGQSTVGLNDAIAVIDQRLAALLSGEKENS